MMANEQSLLEKIKDYENLQNEYEKLSKKAKEVI